MSEGHTDEINLLTLRVETLEQRLGYLEPELSKRIAALEARWGAVESRLERNERMLDETRTQLALLRKDVIGWREASSEELRAVCKAIDDLGTSLLAAVNSLQARAVMDG